MLVNKKNRNKTTKTVKTNSKTKKSIKTTPPTKQSSTHLRIFILATTTLSLLSLLLFHGYYYFNTFRISVTIQNETTKCINSPLFFPKFISVSNNKFEITNKSNQYYSSEIYITPNQPINESERLVLQYNLFNLINVPIKQIDTYSINSEEIFSEIKSSDDNKQIAISITNYFPNYSYSIWTQSQSKTCTISDDSLICQIDFSRTESSSAIVTITKSINTFSTELYKTIIIFNQNSILQESFNSINSSLICTESQICTIGWTQQQTPINAYVYGNGKNKILLFGAIHGNEQNTTWMINELLIDLQNKQIVVPKNKQLIIIPSINPDGYNSSNRFNSNGVDINRNFNATNWQKETYLTDEQTFPNGGGIHPNSEFETQLLSNLIEVIHPYITISYHSWGNYVVPNNLPDAIFYGKIYSQKSRYTFDSPATVNTGFNYSITGTIEEWGEERNIPIMTIELPDLINSDYEHNKPAIVEILNLER